VRARAIILAIPAFTIAELAAPHDPALADLCRGITYASSASITLAYRRNIVANPLVGTGFVVPRGEKETRLLAVSFVTSKWHGRAPDDVVVLRAFTGGMLDADLLARDDEDLVDLAHDGLAPLLGGIHVGDVDRLSLRALFPTLAEADRQPGSVLRTLAARRRPDISDPEGVFRSIPNGLGELVAALTRHLDKDSIRTGVGVTRIEPGKTATPEAISFDAFLSSGEVVSARAIILAIPAFTIAELAAPHDPALADLCRGITYASSASITLAYRRDTVGNPLVGTGFVVPRGEKETRLLAVSFVTSKWHGRAPDDVVVLRAFAGGMLDADLLERDDEDLVDLAHGELSPLLGIRERPFLTRIYRLQRASPQYEPGHQARVEAIERRLADHPGIYFTGSAFRGVGIPDNVADARRTAAEVVKWLEASSAVKMGD
jgi:oxygen-dependent protoporphyrinogen oxidase